MHALRVFALALSLSTPQGNEDIELNRAREELRKCDDALALAEAKIAATYSEFERFAAALKDAPAAPRLDASARAAVEGVRAEIAAGRIATGSDGRAKVIAELRRRMQESAGTLPEFLRAPVAAKLADPIANVAQNPTASLDDVTHACADLSARWFEGASTPHEIWNRGLCREVAPGKEYVKARADRQLASDRLARLEHPERFHPAYERTPEGMVFVLGGTYTLGGNTGYDLDDEKRKNPMSVAVRHFYIDKNEVTCRQYADYLKSLSPADAAARTPASWSKGAAGGAGMVPLGYDDMPVTYVSFEDAAAYAAWAKKRLPTEDEWEAAARGPKAFIYPWGNQYEARRANDRNGDRGGPATVGSFPGDASPWGALDMAGNVMEWVDTLAGGKVAPAKLEENALVVLRGGAFDRDPKESSAVHRWLWPGKTTRVRNLGFRCAKDAF